MKSRSPGLCELWPSLQGLLWPLFSNGPFGLALLSLPSPCSEGGCGLLFCSRSQQAVLSGAIPSLNSHVLPQNHSCDPSHQPAAGSEIHLYPSHPCFQVFSYFGNVIWLPNYQHPVEKQPESVLKHLRALHICQSLLVFFVRPWALAPGKPWRA